MRQGGTGEIGWDRTCSGVGLQVRYDESGTESAEEKGLQVRENGGRAASG